MTVRLKPGNISGSLRGTKRISGSGIGFMMVWHRSKQFAASSDASRSLFGLVIAAAIALVLNGCSNKDTPAATEVKPAKSAPAAPVIVAEVTRQTMPLRVQAIGNVEPFATVAVKARVD